jgi:patatin-like phospholipase/acyl hydrolase
VADAALAEEPFNILSLDGGGAKGFYTLGVLREIEAMTGGPLCETFDLMFGTSTGSIIASLLALGYPVEAIHKLYCKHVPGVMSAWTKAGKTRALRLLGKAVLGTRKFDAFKTGVGIVATNWDSERPMIFKTDPGQAHGRKDSFLPGFGVTIAEAVEASCSAYPFFEKKGLKTGRGDSVTLIDGGYCANNPTLYAIADALDALKKTRRQLRVVSIGVGEYPPKGRLSAKAAGMLVSVQLLQKTLEVNTASMEQLRKLIYADVDTVRISDAFDKPELATDMFEHDLKKLNMLRQQGAESFARREGDLRRLLGL